ncbi:MAG: Ig domain-containing protein, partial [Armatimonadota bacterium]
IPHPTLMPSSPIQARVNGPMSFNVPVRKSIGKAVFALKDGLIRKGPDQFSIELVEGPKWLTIEPTTGIVRGTPTNPGEYRFVIRLVEPAGKSSEKEYIIVAK